MRTQYTFRHKYGEIETPGYSFGYGRDHLSILKTKGDYLIVKKRGTMEWSGVAMPPSYYPVEYWLCRKRTALSDTQYRIEVLIEAIPGRNWKFALNRLYEALEDINTENEEHIILKTAGVLTRN